MIKKKIQHLWHINCLRGAWLENNECSNLERYKAVWHEDINCVNLINDPLMQTQACFEQYEEGEDGQMELVGQAWWVMMVCARHGQFSKKRKKEMELKQTF